MRRFLALLLAVVTTRATAQRCDFRKVPGVVWSGPESRMTVARFVTYMAPIFWFSPDEPNLNGTSGPDIRIPEAFPNESTPARPVVYYQLDRVLTRPGSKGPVIARVEGHPEQSTLDLSTVAVVIIKYFAYYATEEGLGAHPHDIEPVEFRVAVVPSTWDGFKKWFPRGTRCESTNYVIGVRRVSGQAHGLVWFWNVLNTDEYSQFPMHLLIEEGKHAIATDKNGDGVFTKGYDVNVRINDAWGARDIIRTGMLFSGGYESWMTKVRRPEHRVMPPLPEDSPLRTALARRYPGVRNAVYELRPFPPLSSVESDSCAHPFDERQSRPRTGPPLRA
jgi:hypothetical protein